MKSKLFALLLLCSTVAIAQPYKAFIWKDSTSGGVHYAVPMIPGSQIVINGTITDASKLSLSDSGSVWLPYWFGGKYWQKSDSNTTKNPITLSYAVDHFLAIDDTSDLVPYTYLSALLPYYWAKTDLDTADRWQPLGLPFDTTDRWQAKGLAFDTTDRWNPKGLPFDTTDRWAPAGDYPLGINWDSLAVYNIKYYGCVGDSTTNDSTKFASVLSAVASAGGGKIYIPEGTYYIGFQTITSSNIEIYGDGKAKSILLGTHADTFGASILRILSSDTLYDTNPHDIYIHDIGFRDNDTYGFYGSMHQLDTRGVTGLIVERCGFYNSRGNAIYLSGYNASTKYHNRDIYINECYFDGVDTSGSNAIAVIDAWNLHITNNVFLRTCKYNMPGVIDIEPNQTYDRTIDIFIEGNYIKKCGGKVGAISAYLTGGQDAAAPYRRRNFQIINNMIDSCVYTGYAIIWNGVTTPTTATEPMGVIIKGNRIKQATYGIAVSKIVDATISDNTVQSTGRSMSTVSYNIKWINNTFTSTTTPALLIGNSYRLVFDNNKFFSCVGTIFSFNTSRTFEDVIIKNTQVIDPGSVTTTAITMTTPVTYSHRNLSENNNFNGLSAAAFPCINRDWSNYGSYDVFHRAGKYFSNVMDCGTPTTSEITGDRIQAVPFIVSKTRSIDSLMYEVTKEGVGGGTMAIYNDSTAYSISSMPYPMTRLATGGRDTMTVGVKRIGFTAVTLTPGIYWIVFTSNVNVTLRANYPSNVPNIIGGSTYLGTTPTYTGYGDTSYDYDEQAAVTPTTYPSDNTELYRYAILATMHIATIP